MGSVHPVDPGPVDLRESGASQQGEASSLADQLIGDQVKLLQDKMSVLPSKGVQTDAEYAHTLNNWVNDCTNEAIVHADPDTWEKLYQLNCLLSVVGTTIAPHSICASEDVSKQWRVIRTLWMTLRYRYNENALRLALSTEDIPERRARLSAPSDAFPMPGLPRAQGVTLPWMFAGLIPVAF